MSRDAKLEQYLARIAELEAQLAEITLYVGSPYATEVRRIARRGSKTQELT